VAAPLRVCLVSPYYAPHVGGVESHVRDLARYLVRQGDSVTVLTSRFSRMLPALERREGVVVRRVPTLLNVLRTPLMPAVYREVMKGRWDVVHSHSPPPVTAYFACTAANTIDVPHVLTHHADDEVQLPALGPLIVAVYRESLGRYTFAHSAQVVVSSQTYASTSRLVWNYDPQVIGAAIDPSRFGSHVDGTHVREQLGIPPAPEGHMVLFVGRLVPHKGVEFLLEAVQHMRPSATAVVAGEGPHRGTLQRSARALGIEHRVVFAGGVPHEELPAYYRAADVLVLPSISRLEAFGLVGLEAMASERPVVLSDIPGVREVIEDGKEGLLAPPAEPDRLAERVNVLLDDPAMREEMGHRGRERVLRMFTWDVVGAQFRAIYERLASGSEGGGAGRSP
jgi:glycosyltransferase involved in cell wall biosynthesis